MKTHKPWMAAMFLLGIAINPVRVSAFDKPGGSNAERRITLNIARGDIIDALRLVAEQGGLNLVIGPEVKGEVSVYLTDASLQTALRAIAVNNGFTYHLDEGVITVSKPAMEVEGQKVPPLVTRVFTLRCQDAQRVKTALESALSKWGKMSVLNENSDERYEAQRLGSLSGNLDDENGGSGNSFGGANNATQSGSTGPRSASDVTTVAPRNARQLIVTDTEEVVTRISKLVADLDKLPPQVLIEARIVEMSTDLQRQLGIDWDVNILANGPLLNHEMPLNWKAGFASGSQIRRSANGTPASSDGLALGTVDFTQFTAVLRAHQGDNAIRLLANPRLLVFNNHSASILVGERYPILQSTITDFGTVTEAFSTYIPVGVQLEVTPTIMIDGRLSMLVHPVTSSLGDDVIGTTGLRVARIRTRELSTRVLMNDNQTIVLGGLISDRKTRQINKVPGLGDMPLLSALFRQENPRSERVDLLVFLTAHIEGSNELSQDDRKLFEKYKPNFKHLEELRDVPLHFEIPTEYHAPKPMFGDPQPEPAFEEDNVPLVGDEPIGLSDSSPNPNVKSVVHVNGTAHRGMERPGSLDSRATPRVAHNEDDIEFFEGRMEDLPAVDDE